MFQLDGLGLQVQFPELQDGQGHGEMKESSLNSQFLIQIPSSFQLTKDTNFVYLPGEVCQDVKNDVTYICPYSGPKKGTFTITNYRLQFRSTSDRDIPILVDVPLGVVGVYLPPLCSLHSPFN